jgi:hypothetical protein
MAFSEYVLLVSLSAGIPAHGDAGGIAIGPEAVTQPNGGTTRAPAQLADMWKTGQRLTDPTAAVGKTRATAVPPGPTNIRLPAIRPPAIR